MKTKKFQTNLLHIILILGFAFIAIIFHAFLPEDANLKNTNGLLIERFGFKAVAIFYFCILYTHCSICVKTFGNKSSLAPKEIGLRFGLGFGLLYFFGILEVVSHPANPETWNYGDFLIFQSLVGIGDALPAFFMCFLTASFFINKQTIRHEKVKFQKQNFLVVLIIATAFTIERFVCYKFNLIINDYEILPFPCILWTFLFGIVIGCVYFLLLPIYHCNNTCMVKNLKLVALTIGINWIIFNSFIGLTHTNLMFDAILRSSIDIFVLFVTTTIIDES